MSDYLEGALDTETHRLMAEHSLKCPVCHELLNDVQISLKACQTLPIPKISFAKLEAKILEATMPELSMSCEEFEEYLTDYLDGFLPAPLFHRWERHAALCEKCSDLPGLVVRSIGLCYTYKMEEMPIPEGLNERIMQATAALELQTVGDSRKARKLGNTLNSLLARLSKFIRTSLTWGLPQFAPVTMMLIFAIFVLSQMAEGTLGSFYRKSFEMAEKTYRKGASVVIGESRAEKTDDTSKEE